MATIVAALVLAALLAHSASATVTPTLSASYSTATAGAHPNVTQTIGFTSTSDDDAKRLVIDFPAGMLGDPNAILPNNRCDRAYPSMNADGTPSGASPDYSGCPSSSKVGTVSATAGTSGVSAVCGDVSLNDSSNGIFLLKNRPSANPEVPTHLGIHLRGTCSILFVINLTINIELTAKISLRPDDAGLRIEVLDNLPAKDPLLNNEITLKAMSQTINGMAPSPSTKPFLTNPVRCSSWVSKVYSRAYPKDSGSNSNADVDLYPTGVTFADGTYAPPAVGSDFKSASSSQNASCSGIANYNPTFTLTQSTTAAGAPVGLKAVLDNPVVTNNSLQPSYAKEFAMTLPTGFKINPSVAERLGSVGCTEAQFRKPIAPTATFQISDQNPTCPTSSEIGTVAVAAPEITGDLIGKLYLGQPQGTDMDDGRYRLYVFAKRGGLAVKFEGEAIVNAATGQVVVSIKNVTPYTSGLPQFNYSKFTMDFNTASAGVGFDESGNPVSNPVSNPNAQQQMLMNPQVCGSYTASVGLTPWTYSNQAIVNQDKTLTVTAGTNGSCDFASFDPTFDVTLSTTDVGKHPDLDLNVDRPDRRDNLEDLVFRLPDGFGGSIKAVTTQCTVANVLARNCGNDSKVGTVEVKTGAGTLPITLNGDVYIMERTGQELTKYVAKLAIITPAVVGPFDLGSVTNYSYMRLANADKFALISETLDLQQSIKGIPVLYRGIKLKLKGIIDQGTVSTADDKPFLQNPSKCGASLQFQGTFTSAGMAPATGPSTIVRNVNPNAPASAVTTGCAAQTFTPTVAISNLGTAPATPTGMQVQVNVPQTASGVTTSTVQQSTINRVRMVFPAGMEMNPGFASSVAACPTSAIDADIANANADTDTCGTSYATSKIGDVLVDTPLLPTQVSGSMYLEQQGSDKDNRYRFVLYLAMPGGMQIVRGGARVAGSTNGPTAGLGSTSETAGATASTGQALQPGQIEADFSGLPDVAYNWMRLTFNSTVPLFVTPDTCSTNNFQIRVDASNSSATGTPYTDNAQGFTTTGCTTQTFAPTYTQTIPDTTANAHSNVTMAITRPDFQKNLKRVLFHLPTGLTGAPASAQTCSIANSAAGNCTDASVVGGVSVEIGSGAAVATVSGGKLHNTTTANGNEPARLTAIVPVNLGPFNLGKMSLPVSVALRSGDYGLDADVQLPQRYEGIQLRYRKLSVTMNATADQGTPSTADDKPFMTNPSKCQTNTTTVDVWAADNTQASPSPSASFNTTGCAIAFPASTLPTMQVTPTTTDTESPTGVGINLTNGTQASFNPSIKTIKIDFPQGMSVNPAVGNDGNNAVCSSALIDAGGSGCPAASERGTVQITTPLLTGTYNGFVYLEEPGSGAANRFRLAVIIQLPGQKLIIRGKTLINGASDITGATGSVDSGTGVVSAEFDNLIDLPFSSMNLSLYSGNRALLVNPPTCGTQTTKGYISPNTGTTISPQTVSADSTFSTTASNCAPAFAPTFDASLSSSTSGANADLTLTVTNPGKSPQLRNFDMDLPTGLVADTVSTPRCSQVNALAGNCAANTVVGNVTTTIGNSAETLSLAGKLHNVVPDNNNQPARLQAILNVVVGPFNLGKLSIPVITTMRSDYGITTQVQLPYRYEGIDVRLRSMGLVVNGTADQGTPGDSSDDKPFMINPSACQTTAIAARLTSLGGTVVNASKNITINGCPREFPDTPQIPKPAIDVTPSTTETAAPTGLTFQVTNSIKNPTLKQIAIDMPDGMELNPAAGNNLATCSTAQIDAGGADCLATTANLGTVTLDTPLLPAQQSGHVFLEQPLGIDKDTRYRVAIVVHLPGKDLIVRGRVTLDGSTTIPTSGTGSVNTGTGKIRTVFYGESASVPIPDLGFTNMTVVFNSGNRALFTNPRSCSTAQFDAAFTPHGGGADALSSDSYSTTSDCSAPAFAPTFGGSVTPTSSAGNPDITLTAERPAKDRNLVGFDIDLPTGLVASTGNVPLCGITAAAQGNCGASSDVGNVTATIGTGAEGLTINGDLYNVAPQAGEPARLSAGINVIVGPYNLGRLTIPITAELRSDWGVTTHATLPTRYEGIAVRMRSMAITIEDHVGGKPFAVNPSKCQSNTVAANMTSEGPSPQSVAGSFNFSTTGCAAFGSAPSIDVEPSTTQAGSPVGLRIDINSAEGNPSIKRTEFTFPEGLEINPAFGKALDPCPTASIDAGDCTGRTTIADVTLTTPLLSSAPQGKMYLESPGLTKDDRYRVALILDLPGRKLIVRGAISINGTTTIPPGATGSVDQGTGQLKADFDDIPDLAFTQLRLDFNAGSKAMVVNPTTCNAHEFTGTFTPNSVATKASSTDSYTPTGCVGSFNPTFTATPSNGQSAGHPDLTLRVVNAPNQQEQLRKLKVKLPVGLVANTTATTRCSQSDAANGDCLTGQAVGEFSTKIGSTSDTVDLSGGKIYNVEPNADEPARMQAVIPVLVGPFDLGKLSIPVTTKLNADMSVDADTTIPLRYEGINVKIVQMDMVLRGTVGANNFIVNPSRCAAHTISGVMESATGLTNTDDSTFTTTGCAPVDAAYNPSVSFSNTPNTAGAPTNLGMNVSIPADSSTTSNVKVIFPEGFELSPGAGDGLLACAPSDVNAGGGACPATSRLASVTLTTPLLSDPQDGELFLEPSIGNQAATRYRLAMVVHLPGQNLIVRGGTLIDGSSELIDDLGSKDTGTGQVTAEFPGLPDLGFSGLQVDFDGAKKLFVNPKTCDTFSVLAELTAHAGTAAKQRTGSLSTTGGTCGQNSFAPQITGSLSPTTTGGNPDLHLDITNADGMNELKSFDLHLPEGLVARTTGVPQCPLGDAALGNCSSASTVGEAITTIGSAGETLSITGDIVNVVPDSGQPARLQAIVPVIVGPFNLGNLTVDVPTKLNSDLTVTASAILPERYEGIAVRVRELDMTIEGAPSGGRFMVAPSKCGPGTISADFTSNLDEEASDSFGFTIDGCAREWDANPSMTITASPPVRNAPANLNYTLTSDADNPTISRLRVEMPDDMEINPAFGSGLAACSASAIDAGGAGCPSASKIGVVTLRTQLLDPAHDYPGDVYLETPGTSAATRFRIAIVAHLPGADLVVRGKVTVTGSTDITGGTGSTSYAGPGKIVAEFDEIPDLGFTYLSVTFNTNRPMLINPPQGGTQTFQVDVTPHSGGADAELTPSYVTSGGTTPALFNPSFSASVTNTASGAHPDLNLQVSRANNNSETIRDLDLELPVGLVASTVASTRCAQASADAGTCPASSRVGSFTTRFGNGATSTEDLQLSGDIFNVLPNADEPARLSAMVNVLVGPFDLGKLAIPIETALRADAGIDTTTALPVRYEGIAVRIKQLNITLFGTADQGTPSTSDDKPFMQNPSKCQSNAIRARITSASGSDTVVKQSSYTTTGCPLGFASTPTVDVSVDPSETTVPTSLAVEINSAASNPTIGKIAMKLPVGMSVNAAVGNNGEDTTCATAQLDSDPSGCPAASRQGDVELETPLLGDTYTGSVYLEDPFGSDASTRYRVAIVLDLPGKQIVVHGRVEIDGSTSGASGGTGSIDQGTGQVTAYFDAIPDLSFSRMAIAFDTGPRALLTNADSCGIHTVETTITPSSGGAGEAAVVNSNFSTSFDGAGEPCPTEQPFAPDFSVSAADHMSGANTDLSLTLDSGAKDQQLRDFTVHLPAGLVADTDATDHCAQIDAEAADCGAGSLVGSVQTKLGTGSETLDLSGSIYNVEPNSDEPARLAAIMPVVVGPYNLGNLSIQVPTVLRPGDYGVDAHAQIPTKYEGILVRIRQMQMEMLGNVGGNGFIKNPSKCSAGSDAISATMISASGKTVTDAEDYAVTGCPLDFDTSPTITVSNVETEVEKPTGMTLDIDTADNNPTIGSIKTTMPEGMTLNPAVGNKVDACSTADIDAGGENCPAASIVGTAQMQTALLAGTHPGKVYLETPGTTAGDRYKVAVIVDLPGTNVIVRGVTEVDGSSDLVDGMGSTDESATGRVVADFNDLPDLNFSHMRIAFDSGPGALFANSSECGTQTVSAEFAPQSGGASTTASDSFDLSWDGQGASCPATRDFEPVFSGEFSSTLAANNPDVTLRVAREDKNEQLREFNLHLPAGLVADTVQTPRCPVNDSLTGDCDPDTVVGDVSTQIGTGSDLLTMSGKLHNVVPVDLDNEPARFAVVFDVVVGPYDLGKLSIPVTTEIVTGAEPSDLTIDTHTTVPKRYEGVPIRLRQLEIELAGTVAGKPFMINPSKCGTHTIGAEMISTEGTVKNGSFDFTTNGCPANFNPSIETSIPTAEAGIPTGFTFGVLVPGNSSSVRSVTTTLPEGFEINPGVANRGGANALEACSTADIDAGGSACPASSRVGEVKLDTPLLPTQRTGYVYLETPGNTPSTRYKLAIVISLPGPDLIVHGQAQVNGTGTGVGGGTGQVSAVFDNLPDLQFSKLEVTFDSGDHAMLTSPKTCGTFTSSAQLTPWSIADGQQPQDAAVTRTDSDAVSTGCDNTFAPTFEADVSDHTQAASPDLNFKVTAGAKDQRLSKLTLGLPVGLVANTTAVTQCSQADAAAGNCAAGSKVGELSTTVGAGGDPLAMSGEIFNVVPNSDEPARLAATVDVQVGPYDLGKLVIPVSTKIRSGNDANPQRRYGIDAVTDVPTRFEGVAIQMRTIDMTMYGEISGNRFVVNPSKCGSHDVTAELEGQGGESSTLTDSFTIDSCAAGFATAPSIMASVDPSETALPTNFTLGVTSDADNQTFGSIATELPEGMTINPAFGNGFGTTMSTCPTASIDAGDLSDCDSAQIGSVSLTTPLLPGTQTGKVYLETPGGTAATRYLMAIVVNVPGQKLIVRGSVDVDGSTDLVNGIGSTDASATGQMTATFDDIPDLGFTNMTVAFDTGERSLLTNPETCGAQNVTASIMPTSGTIAAEPVASFVTSYDGQGAPCPAPEAEPFAPTFNASFSDTKAAGNPDMTIDITRQDKTQQLEQLDIELPAGLVANTVATPRCDLDDANLAACAETSRVGDVTTRVGTGDETLPLSGGIYNVETSSDDEPARLAAVLGVKVGPYNLGKLSVPVTTEIVGNTASTLRILTHTTLPSRYEGIPVRVRQMQIKLDGTVNGNPFMINPSRCNTHTVTAHMTSSEGATHDGTDSYTTDSCDEAPYNPSLSVALKPNGHAGKPVGLDLGFAFAGSSSSTKSIRTTLPVGMSINPGIGNLASGGQQMACDPAVVDAGGAACPANSRIGTVKLDTPLLPTQRTGTVFLETPGTGSANRYRIGIYVSLPGSSLVVHGRATVNGSSDLADGLGSVNQGNGQVIAEFDNLPDLQFSNLLVEFNTTGSGKHALLTNPETCGSHVVRAQMVPWSRDTDPAVEAADTIAVNNCNGPEGALGLTASVDSLAVGVHSDVTMNLTRPDGNRSILNAKFELPKGLVGSADAAPTCLDDATHAQIGNCDAATQVGEVEIGIGSSEDVYTLPGEIYNVVADADHPAKLVFASHVVVGPFDLGRVVVPIEVNIDPDDYFLWAQTGDMPQRFEGIPVRISALHVKLFGMAKQGTLPTADDKPFMSNPRSCTSALDIKATVNFTTGSPADLTGSVGPFTGCESLNLNDNSVDIENYNDESYDSQPLDRVPEAPTKLRVTVSQGDAATQAGMKDMALSLPGFRLSAAAADGSETCSNIQLAAKNCPAKSRVGTAWLDTSLLPKNVADPNSVNPDLHSLWGSVYLLTPGNTAGDRYKLAIQMTGKTTITIRGTAIVAESGVNEGELVTEFKDLPDIPFDEMEVDLTGVDAGSGVKPLLLNPENPSTTDPLTVAAGASMSAWSDGPSQTPVTKSSTSPVSVLAGTAKGFAPASSYTISTTQSGAHPNFSTEFTRADGEQDIRRVMMHLPEGFLGSAAAVPQCPVATANAGNCSSASKVGDVQVSIGQYGQILPMSGSIYLTEGVGGDIAGMSIKVPAVAGDYDLGDYITQGRVQIRESDHGIDVDFQDVPKLFKGVPTHMSRLEVNMQGTAQSTNKPFLFNASDCKAQQITASMTSWGSPAATSSQDMPYQATGCPVRAFTPALSFTAHGGGVGNPPAWTIKMGSNVGDSTLAGTTVVLPTALTINVAGIAQACTAEQAAARACPGTAKIGTVSVNTPLLTTPVEGNVYMARSISGSSLPDLLMDIPAPINLQIRGANRFVGAQFNQVQSTFQNLPDLIFTDLTMSIAGGPNGLVMLRSNGVCGSASTNFTSHSGQQVSVASPIIGIDGFCAEQQRQCLNPSVKVSTKGIKKKGNKKATTSLAMTTGENCKSIKSVRVSYPKGTKVDKKLVTYNKKKKATKKNLKNLTGKAGTKKLQSDAFKFSGNRLQFKAPFADGTRGFSITSKNSAIALPFKTFCGGLKGKKLKKCQKKNVTFTFEVTNSDGTAFRYDYTVPAGSKFFK